PAGLIEALVRRLDDAHPGVIQASLESLTRLIDAELATVDRSALDRAIALAEHVSPLVRNEAVAALAVFCPNVEHPQREALVLGALEDPDPAVRRTAIAACGDLELTAARAALKTKLGESSLRFEAAFALASLGDSSARASLEAGLQTSKTRLDALEGLRRLGDREAVAAVRSIADSWLTSWADRLSAWATLHVLGVEEASEKLVKRISSRRMEERVYAMYLVGKYRVQAGRETIDAIANNTSDRDRETALDALGGFADDSAATVLVRVAEDVDETKSARITAASALTRISVASATEAISRLQRDPDPAIREAVRTSASL
ncbi:MAG: HEAT repeat domain-containing protein, partial [Myxococcota bacterium]